MPITISYNDFITPTGSMSTGIDTPGSFSPIASNITNLDASDMRIIFTGLPNGLKVTSTQDTPTPFDSVYMDIGGYDDYILMSGSDNVWSVGGLSALYLSSAGFWAMGGISDSPGLMLTGVGNIDSSIMDIQFEPINYMETTYTKNDADSGPLILERGRKYILDSYSYGTFVDPIIFNQDSYYDWYPVEIVTSGNVNDTVIISGTSHSGNGSFTTVTAPFSGLVYWQDDTASMILNQNSVDNLASYPLTPFPGLMNEGVFDWYGTYANENFSLYSVLSDNSGNTGTAVIQLSSSTVNGDELFTDLIPPLRKVYVTFTDNP